jgi:hypothetical protein
VSQFILQKTGTIPHSSRAEKRELSIWACMQAEKVTSNVPIHSAKWKQIYFLFHQSKKERSIWACTHSENVMSLVCQFITDIGRYNSSHNEAV